MAIEALSTEGRDVGNPSSQLQSRPSRRHWRLILAILVVLAFVIGSGAYLANYMPMFPANATAGGLHREELGSFVSPRFKESFSVAEYTYQRGARFWFGFGLRNDGPLGVTVTRIDSRLPGPDYFNGLAQQSGVWIRTTTRWYGPPRESGPPLDEAC